MKGFPRKPFLSVCDLQGGTQPPKSTFRYKRTDGYIRLVQIRDYESDDKQTFVPATAKLKTCVESDVMIARYGASTGRILRGKAGAYNVALVKTLPDENQLSKDFLFHWLNSPFFQGYLAKVANRAAQAGFNRDDLGQLEIPVPPLAEQERIGKLLGEADELRKTRAQADRRTAALIPALFHEMFGDPDINPQGWSMARLEDVAPLKSGYAFKSTDYRPAGIRLVRISNLDGQNMVFDDGTAYLPESFRDAFPAYQLSNGDVLIAMSGATTGKLGMVRQCDTPSLLNQRVGKFFIRDTSVLEPAFLFSTLRFPAMTRKLIGEAAGSAQANVSPSGVGSVRIPVPPLSLQKEFAQRVNKIRDLEAEQAKSRKCLDDLFASMVHFAFNEGL